jgi:hypothetical protein
MTRHHPVTTAAVTAVILLLTGCTAAAHSTPPGFSRAPSSPITTTTSTPSASASAAQPGGTPTGTATGTSTTGFTTSAQQPAAAGCGTGHARIPAGASTATIGDVDHDGRPDTEFISTHPRLEYGIRTDAGDLATITVTGSGTVSGWTATGFDGPLFPLTVIDNGKQADLYAFIGCRFIRTLTTTGAPFTFRLGHSAVPGPGTGVACTDQNGGRLLARADAVALADGRYDIRWTTIHYTDQGHHATYQPPAETRYSGLHPDDPPVAAADRSSCLDTPIVHGSST